MKAAILGAENVLQTDVAVDRFGCFSLFLNRSPNKDRPFITCIKKKHAAFCGLHAVMILWVTLFPVGGEAIMWKVLMN